jgi:HD-like signal output (HDOD) protein
LQAENLSVIFPFKEEWKGWLYIPDKVRKVTLDDMVFYILNLSRLPSTNIPVLYEINRYDSSAADVAKAIENDWNLAARILKLANSAFYGLGEEVADIQRAITLLGFDTVRSLIYMSAIYRGLEKVKGPVTSDATFLHCLATSCATQYFSKNLNQQERSLISTAGLFHDVGKVLCSHISKVKTEAALDGMKGNISFDCAQLDSFGVSHYLMTAILLDLWHFPYKLTNLLLETAPGARVASEEASVLRDASLFAAKLGFNACGTEPDSTGFGMELKPDEEKAAKEGVLYRVAVFDYANS